MSTLDQGRIRLVSWNIEKGKRWRLLEKCLDSESIRTADVLCLNEVDDGMARSGNHCGGPEHEHLQPWIIHLHPSVHLSLLPAGL